MTLSWRWALFTQLSHFLPLFPFPFVGVAVVAEGATAVLTPVAVGLASTGGTGPVLADFAFPPRCIKPMTKLPATPEMT